MSSSVRTSRFSFLIRMRGFVAELLRNSAGRRGATSRDGVASGPRRYAVCLLVLHLFQLTPRETPAQTVDDMTPYIPGSVNAVAVIRVRELMRSPRGELEGWSRTGEMPLLTGIDYLPMQMEFVVRAAHVDPQDPNRSWSLNLLPWPSDASMSLLARREGGEAGVLGERGVVAGPRNRYFVRIEPRILGVIQPATRQEISRWISSMDARRAGKQPVVSEYLNDALKWTSVPIVMALDTQDLLDPRMLRAQLATSRVMEGRATEVPTLAAWLGGLRGVTFAARVDDRTEAMLRFDFATAVGPRAELMKRLLIEFLEERGAVIDELADADVVVAGRTMELTMSLSDVSLRQVMSLFASPGAVAPPQNLGAVGTPSSDTGGPGSAGEPTGREAGVDPLATRRYYASVLQLLDDLERLNRRANNYLKTAAWHESFAQRIDSLSIRGVDDQVARYGSSVAHNLRGLANSLRGVPLQVQTLERAITREVQGTRTALTWDYWFGYTYVPAGGGYTQFGSNLAKIREEQATVINRGTEERQKIWNQLLAERSQIRQWMAERYPEIERTARPPDPLGRPRR